VAHRSSRHLAKSAVQRIFFLLLALIRLTLNTRMTRIKSLFASAMVLISSALWAQQDVQFTQYYHNRLGFNPGVAGSGEGICVNMGQRLQWVGFEGAPNTLNVNASIPLDVLHGGLMVNIVNDRIGFFEDVSAALGYAYQMDLGTGRLGLGLAVDFKNKNVRNAQWIYPDNPSDPAVVGNGATSFTPELNFGAYYTTDTWFAGLSTSRLLQSDAPFSGSSARFKSTMHYFLTGGYSFDLPTSTPIRITPSVLLKSDLNSNLSIDLNANAVLMDKIYAGLGYRNQDAMSIMLGYQILPSLRASYSYDLTTSSLSAYSSGSHELFLTYCFTIEIPPRVNGSYRNPRFL
jgi:type IX secretion system PorP/SprF family membrane protein